MGKNTPSTEASVADETVTVTAPDGTPVEDALRAAVTEAAESAVAATGDSLEAALEEGAKLAAAADAATAQVDSAASVDLITITGASIEDAIVEPLTVDDAVRALIGSLQHKESFIRAIEIRANGTIRIIGNDNSARSVRFEALERKGAGA